MPAEQVDNICKVRQVTFIGPLNVSAPVRNSMTDATHHSIFAISIGAYLGASNPLLAPVASDETWAMLRLARDVFGDDCRCSPSLFVMRESIRETLASIPVG